MLKYISCMCDQIYECSFKPLTDHPGPWELVSTPNDMPTFQPQWGCQTGGPNLLGSAPPRKSQALQQLQRGQSVSDIFSLINYAFFRFVIFTEQFHSFTLPHWLTVVCFWNWFHDTIGPKVWFFPLDFPSAWSFAEFTEIRPQSCILEVIQINDAEENVDRYLTYDFGLNCIDPHRPIPEVISIQIHWHDCS